MADMAAVNRVIRQRFPDLDIKAVRGDGYVYFTGADGFDVKSIYSNPPTTTTGTMIRMCVENIEDEEENLEIDLDGGLSAINE